jgi:tetratricopeptide (TPR) repeat protein
VLLLFAGAASAQPEDGPLWRARTMMGQFRTALENAEAARTAGDLESAQTQQQAAGEHLRQARELFEAGGAGASADRDVLMDYGDALGAMGDTDLAAEAYQRATEAAPGDAETWLALGRARAQLGTRHAPAAVDALRKSAVLADEPAPVAEAHARLGLLYYDEGLFDFAGDAFRDALVAREDHRLARAGMACLAARDGDVLAASETLDALGMLGGAEASIVDRFLPEALRDFEQRRRWFPDDAAHHAAYGKLLLRANQVAYSMYPLERAVELDADNYVYWNLLASAARFLGDTDRARAAYEKSLAANPNQPFVEETLKALQPEQPRARPLFMAPEDNS